MPRGDGAQNKVMLGMKEAKGCVYMLWKKWSGLMLCLVLSAGMPTAMARNPVIQTPIEDHGQAVPTPQEDFYLYANHEWMQKTKIAPDEGVRSIYGDMEDEVRDDLKEITKQAVRDRARLGATTDEARIADLYACIQDRKGREAAGYGQLAQGLQAIEQVKDLQGYAELMGKFNQQYPLAGQDSSLYTSFHGPMIGGISIVNHPIDNDRYVVNLTGPSTGLGHEFMTDESNAPYFAVYRSYIKELLVAYGRKPAEAERAAEGIFRLESDLARQAIPLEERMDPSKSTHKVSLQELQALCPHVDVQAVLNAAEAGPAQGIQEWFLSDPALLQYFDTLYTEARLPLLKDYAVFMLLSNNSRVLPSAYQEIQLKYDQTMSGAVKRKSTERQELDLNESLLMQNYGRLYVKRYFSAADKKEVTSYVTLVRDTYKKRISQLEWMSPATKQAAIAKLDHMAIYVAEPGVWPEYIDSYTFVRPEQGGTLIDNTLSLSRIIQKAWMARLGKPVQKGLWEGFSAQTVNAFYDPSSNSINFPAGELRAPYYDSKNDRVVNLGETGAIIGHEITHAIDSNGAQYDAEGRLRNWWTPKDYAEFKDRQAKVIALYSSYQLPDGTKINGAIALTENIADLGAVSCLTEVVGKDPAVLRQFYRSYAESWQLLLRKEMLKKYLVDVHALPYLRVNAVLSSTQSFYDAFGVKPGDGMYIAPEERANIW